MSKVMMWEKLYLQPVYPDVARLIGYTGVSASAFLEAAKDLIDKHGKQKVMIAVYELTQYDLRERSDPRYELNGEARKWCLQLLGPPPEHLEYRKYYTINGRPVPGEEPAAKDTPKEEQPPVSETPKAEEARPPKKRTRKKTG